MEHLFSLICQYGNLMAIGKIEEAGTLLSKIHQELESQLKLNFNAGIRSTKWDDEL